MLSSCAFERARWKTKDQPKPSDSETNDVFSTNAANCSLLTSVASIRNGETTTGRAGSSPSPGHARVVGGPS